MVWNTSVLMVMEKLTYGLGISQVISQIGVSSEKEQVCSFKELKLRKLMSTMAWSYVPTWISRHWLDTVVLCFCLLWSSQLSKLLSLATVLSFRNCWALSWGSSQGHRAVMWKCRASSRNTQPFTARDEGEGGGKKSSFSCGHFSYVCCDKNAVEVTIFKIACLGWLMQFVGQKLLFRGLYWWLFLKTLNFTTLFTKPLPNNCEYSSELHRHLEAFSSIWLILFIVCWIVAGFISVANLLT